MRLPRDLSGRDLAKALRKLGYDITRQTSSHIRLRRSETASTTSPSQTTIPSALARSPAFLRTWRDTTREELVRLLFSGK